MGLLVYLRIWVGPTLLEFSWFGPGSPPQRRHRMQIYWGLSGSNRQSSVGGRWPHRWWSIACNLPLSSGSSEWWKGYRHNLVLLLFEGLVLAVGLIVLFGQLALLLFGHDDYLNLINDYIELLEMIGEVEGEGRGGEGRGGKEVFVRCLRVKTCP